MLKRTFNLDIDKAYADLKSTLIQRGCKIVSEEAPKHLVVKQGSIWGMSPATAKKTVDVAFTSADSGTEVASVSRISSDWKNLTIVGCALAAVLVGVCLWMALDLTTFMNTGKASFWSWLAAVNGNVDVSAAQAFVNLTKALAVFLSLIIVLEAIVFVYAHRGIDKFTQETFDALTNKENTANTPKQ